MIIDIADRLSNHIVLFGITLILGTFVHIWYSESRDIVNKRGLTRSFVISKFGCTIISRILIKVVMVKIFFHAEYIYNSTLCKWNIFS